MFDRNFSATRSCQMDAVTVAGKRNAKREGTCFSIVICLYACSNYAKQVLVASEIPKTVELALLD